MVTFWSITSIVGSAPDSGLPVVAERDDLAVLGGFGQVGVGVDEVVGAGVLGEERQHGRGRAGSGWARSASRGPGRGPSA